MAYLVKCLYCEERFDRNKEPTQKIGRRYAHLKCWEEHQKNMTQEERDQEAFFEYTRNLFRDYNYNYILTKKLAERFVKENNYTYSGMLKTLKWYYEKEGGSLENSNGSIGIIPYIYNKALQYYYNLYKAQLINKEKDPMQFIGSEKRSITIESPRVLTRPPHMWFEEDNE